ncbi:MAG: hypothetical protein Q9163_002297 [Psora crenata]
MPECTRPIRAIASSPVPAAQHNPQPQAPLEGAVRQMRHIRTAYLDESTQVGVIEIKTCLQAITTASPEIVAKLGQDYTVYAYDYSEYETPLVGQGMLSWILASSSPTPGAPAHQSRTIVTGRVCNSMLGLFSNSSQETLEVKLRLVPVPTSLQSEYIESMKRYRDISQMMPPGFDPQAWTSFLQANPGFMPQIMQSRSQSPAMGMGQTGGFGIERVQRLLNNGAQQSVPNECRQTFSRTNSFGNANVGQQLPRLPSPASSVVTVAAAPKRRGRKPGPNYKGPRPRRTASKQAPAPESADPGYATGDERFEEGPSRKRAKVVQAEWDGKQDFGRQPDSLRVAASTAASVRIHQPTAVRAGNNAHLSLESQPRAPTPIPDPSKSQRRSHLPGPKSNLGRQSLLADSADAPPYTPAANSDRPSPLAMSSPEKSQIESSPPDIASSPPVFPGNHNTRSSPRLPEFPSPSFHDSGFTSANFEDLFEDDELRPLDDEDYAVAAQYIKRSERPAAATHETYGQGLPDNETDDQNPRAEDHDEAPYVKDGTHRGTESRKLGQTTSSGNLQALPAPASDPIRPSTLEGSQAWCGNQAPHPASDFTAMLPEPVDVAPEKPVSNGKGRKHSDMGGQSGVKRKAVIQNNLKASIAAGQVPPFCENCGAIETPTWRRAWSKTHSGTPEHVRLSEEEGGILAWQTLQTDSNGAICLYRIIKKSLAKHDEGFTDILLCNPCGLWLYTRKCMRPKEAWDKTQKGPDDKRRRRSGGKGPNPGGSSTIENRRASSRELHSVPSSPTNGLDHNDAVEGAPWLPTTKRRRATGTESSPPRKGCTLDDVSAAAALERAIQSSPHNFRGSQQAPIEVGDLTPRPTRRILFPSPTQSGQAKNRHHSVSGTTSLLSKPKFDQTSLAITHTEGDKENRPPLDDDSFQPSLDMDGYEGLARPSTPTPSNLKPVLFETPIRSSQRPPPTTGEFFSSAARAFLHSPSTPKCTPMKYSGPLTELTPFTAHLNQLLSEADGGSPGTNGNNFGFPTLPSLRNTPNKSGDMDFDLTRFDPQDLISTDVPMASSPPAWNFSVYGESTEPEAQGSLWGEFTLRNSIASPQTSDGGVVEGEKEDERGELGTEKVTPQAEAIAAK